MKEHLISFLRWSERYIIRDIVNDHRPDSHH